MHLNCSPVVTFILIIHFTLIVLVDGYSKAPPRLASNKAKSNPVIYQAGSKVQLQCPVYADPQRLFVEWMRNNVPVDHVHRYFVTLNGYLRIEYAQIEDSGVYTCKAVNGFGFVYANITLSILSAEDVSSKRFTSTGSRDGFFRNNKIANTKVQSVNIDQNNHLDSDHVDPDINTNHHNGNDYEYDDDDLINRYDTDGDDYYGQQGPYFLTPPTTKVIKKNFGKPLRLRCNVDGKPKPVITWYKNGFPISPSQLNSAGGENTKPAPQSILFVSEARIEDSGYYMCVASNPKGQINATFSVIISDKLNRPEIIAVNPENNTVLLGQKAFFECQFKSKLQPLVKWLKMVTAEELEEEVEENRGILIEIDNEYYTTLKTPTTTHKKDGIFYNRLIIDSVDRRDSGKYLCSVVNYKGYAYRTTFLTVASAIEMNQLRDFGFSGINYCTLLVIVIAIIGCIVLVIFLTFFLIDHREGGRRSTTATTASHLGATVGDVEIAGTSQNRRGLRGRLAGRFMGRGFIFSDPISKADATVKFPILEERYHPSFYHHHVKHLQPPTPTFNQSSSSNSNNNKNSSNHSTSLQSNHHHHHHLHHILPSPSSTSASLSGNDQPKTHHHHFHSNYQKIGDYHRTSKEYASYQKITKAVVEKTSSPSTARSFGLV